MNSCTITQNPDNPDTVRDPLLAELIARNAIEWAEYQDGTQWIQASYLYELLRQSPEVREAYPVLDSFYTAMQEHGMEDMGGAEEWLADIADSTVLADAAAFDAWYAAAIEANNAIDTNMELQMANEQMVNDIYLRYTRYGISAITPEDYSNIENLALECPLVAGSAVYKARMLYSLYRPSLSYDDLDICNTAGLYKGGEGLFDDENALLAQQSAVIEDGSHLKVYPNPTTGLLTLEYSIATTDKAELIISDVFGKIVKRVRLTGNKKTTVEIGALPPAVYFYRYLVNNATENTGKIVLIK